jgi:SAM-dependent methyltransferase
MSNQIENFWNKCHDENVVASLSGCRYEETIEFLKVTPLVFSGATVLEVGVGMGYVTQGLFNSGLKVSSLDISPVALERVRPFCEALYNTDNLGFLPSYYFDLIICNNVVQHVPTDTLVLEIKEIMRSLKFGGVMAVEFVSSDLFQDNGANPPLESIKGGVLCRTPEFLENIFNAFGGECRLVFDKKISIDILRGHHVFHVKKVNNFME